MKLVRRNLLIYPRFQLTLIVLNTLILATMFGLISFQVSSALKSLNQTGAARDLIVTLLVRT